jgi:hypothetical protein
MADQIHETTKAPVTAASSGWPPPMSEALIQRQREYRDWLNRKLGPSKVGAAFRKAMGVQP